MECLAWSGPNTFENNKFALFWMMFTKLRGMHVHVDQQLGGGIEDWEKIDETIASNLLFLSGIWEKWRKKGRGPLLCLDLIFPHLHSVEANARRGYKNRECIICTVIYASLPLLASQTILKGCQNLSSRTSCHLLFQGLDESNASQHANNSTKFVGP